ncbi:hypothetical protein ABKU52_22775, partial [Enterobacter hormaechei]
QRADGTDAAREGFTSHPAGEPVPAEGLTDPARGAQQVGLHLFAHQRAASGIQHHAAPRLRHGRRCVPQEAQGREIARQLFLLGAGSQMLRHAS